MDELKQRLAGDLELWAKGVRKDYFQAVFAVGLTQDGSTQLVLVDPDDRDSLMIAINEELTRMQGSPHHVVSTEKLADFLQLHKISEQDLLNFEVSQNKNDGEQF